MLNPHLKESAIKTLSKDDLKTFMERFDDLKGGELIALEILSATQINIKLSAQDKNRAYDWVDMNFECHGVMDAKLVSDSALKAIDMQEGANITFDEQGVKLGFGSSEYLSSPLSLYTSTLKYEESAFTL